VQIWLSQRTPNQCVERIRIDRIKDRLAVSVREVAIRDNERALLVAEFEPVPVESTNALPNTRSTDLARKIEKASYACGTAGSFVKVADLDGIHVQGNGSTHASIPQRRRGSELILRTGSRPPVILYDEPVPTPAGYQHDRRIPSVLPTARRASQVGRPHVAELDPTLHLHHVNVSHTNDIDRGRRALRGKWAMPPCLPCRSSGPGEARTVRSRRAVRDRESSYRTSSSSLTTVARFFQPSGYRSSG
jgi:hypothetical protein